MARTFSLAILLATLLGNAVAVDSQNPDNYLFAGRSLGDLQAVLLNSPLQTKMLQKEIDDDQLDALYVPAAQGDPKLPVVERTHRGHAKLEALKITAKDLKTLQEFAEDGIYALAKGFRTALLSGNAAGIQKSRADIDTSIAKLPPAKQDQAKRFVGALISEISPDEKFVDDYRTFVEERMKKGLADGQNPLSPGQPYAFGAGKQILHSLKTVSQDQVKEFSVDDKTYRNVWIGSTLVVVPQMSKSPAKGPTGFDSLHLNNNLKAMIFQEQPGGKIWIQKLGSDG